MTELSEVDPRLTAVRVKQSGRDLLDPQNPNPLAIDVRAGRNVRFALVIENGPQGLIDLTVTSDEAWLEPETKHLTLVGGESGQCILSAKPDGDTEFANLIFTWPGIEKPLSASVMLMRKLPQTTPGSSSANPLPSATPLPTWRQDGTYNADISRDNPTCFLFLLDQSGSMAKPIAGESGKKKAIFLADQLNLLLYELVGRCSKGMDVRDYFHVGVIGYGDVRVRSALGGELSGRELVPISQLAEHPLRVDTRTVRQCNASGEWADVTVNLPVWYEAAAGGRTPMCAALVLARDFIKGFLQKYPRCRPPVVINITDGAATDGDPRKRAAPLLNLASSDGNVLLFNLHVSSSNDQPIHFPMDESVISDRLAKMLFQMSSPIPPPMLALARASMPGIVDGARGFVFNADMVSTVQMLDIGTRSK